MNCSILQYIYFDLYLNRLRPEDATDHDACIVGNSSTFIITIRVQAQNASIQYAKVSGTGMNPI